MQICNCFVVIEEKVLCRCTLSFYKRPRSHDFMKDSKYNTSHVKKKQQQKRLFAIELKPVLKQSEIYHYWQEEKSIYSFCVPLNKKSPKLMMSVFCSNSLIHAPECRKCILRDQNFQNFPGEHAPGPP